MHYRALLRGQKPQRGESYDVDLCIHAIEAWDGWASGLPPVGWLRAKHGGGS